MFRLPGLSAGVEVVLGVPKPADIGSRHIEHAATVVAGQLVFVSAVVALAQVLGLLDRVRFVSAEGNVGCGQIRFLDCQTVGTFWFVVALRGGQGIHMLSQVG